jgi:hypothetical protein
VAMGAGLRPKAKGLDKPPDPTVRAPVLDPTGRGWLEKYRRKAATRWPPTSQQDAAACKPIQPP